MSARAPAGCRRRIRPGRAPWDSVGTPNGTSRVISGPARDYRAHYRCRTAWSGRFSKSALPRILPTAGAPPASSHPGTCHRSVEAPLPPSDTEQVAQFCVAPAGRRPVEDRGVVPGPARPSTPDPLKRPCEASLGLPGRGSPGRQKRAPPRRTALARAGHRRAQARRPGQVRRYLAVVLWPAIGRQMALHGRREFWTCGCQWPSVMVLLRSVWSRFWSKNYASSPIVSWNC